MTVPSIFRRIWRDTGAAAAAEMVLILPLAVFMLMLAMEAGYFMYVEHEVMKSVRDAARWGSRQPLGAFNCTGAQAETALPSDGSTLGTINSNIVTLARYGRLDNSAPMTVAGWSASDVKVTYDCVPWTTGIYEQQQFAPRITVIGTPDYPALFGGAAVFSGSNKLFARQQAVVVGV